MGVKGGIVEIRLKFTPLEFETNKSLNLLENFQVKIYSVGV